MSGSDDSPSTSALPGLTPLSTATQPSSISTGNPENQPPTRHVTTPPMPPKVASAIDFTKVHTELGANPLIKSAITRIPCLTGDENYNNWSDQLLAALKYCGIEKIITDEWAQPTVDSNDASSMKNVKEWEALDTWIWLHFNLSDSVCSQVRHLNTSCERWNELKKLFKPTSATSITLHLLSSTSVSTNWWNSKIS